MQLVIPTLGCILLILLIPKGGKNCHSLMNPFFNNTFYKIDNDLDACSDLDRATFLEKARNRNYDNPIFIEQDDSDKNKEISDLDFFDLFASDKGKRT